MYLQLGPEASCAAEPRWEGGCRVSVRFVSEVQVVEVLDTIQQQLAERGERSVKSMTVALEDVSPSPSGHGRPTIRVVRDESGGRGAGVARVVPAPSQEIRLTLGARSPQLADGH